MKRILFQYQLSIFCLFHKHPSISFHIKQRISGNVVLFSIPLHYCCLFTSECVATKLFSLFTFLGQLIICKGTVTILPGNHLILLTPNILFNRQTPFMFWPEPSQPGRLGRRQKAESAARPTAMPPAPAPTHRTHRTAPHTAPPHTAPTG